MNRILFTSVAAAAFALTAVSKPAVPGNDLVVSSGDVLVYDTASGPLALDNLVVEAGGVLRVVGDQSFRVDALGSIRVDGTIDLSGFDANDVATLNTGNLPEAGAAGGPAGGTGGSASRNATGSTAQGSAGAINSGGQGGESGYGNASIGQSDARRPGGGGGGRLAADQPGSPGSTGLVAQPGQHGAALALGALSAQSPPQGGAAGAHVFIDGDPSNDFYGVQVTASGSIVGELSAPLAGSGGGGGGDAVPSITFPNTNWQPASDEKGAGGGGGGGLGILQTRLFTMGPKGSILAAGGDGAAGENTLFFNRVGGGSGGGSGGMILIQARLVDLSQASSRALSARGGDGGSGANDIPDSINAGGDGGPGLIQVHVADPSLHLLLPAGASIDNLSSPSAKVLAPIPGL